MEEITIKKAVDDYEHSGDTERDVKAWKSIGGMVKVHPPSYPEDDPAPMLEITLNADVSTIRSWFPRLKRSIESAKRSGDYGGVLHPYDLDYVLSQIDRKYRTKHLDEFRETIDRLSELYSS